MHSRTQQTLRFFIRHLKPFKWLYTAMTVSMVCAVLLELTVPIVYKQIFDAVLGSNSIPTPELVQQVFGFVLLILVIQILMNALFRFNEFSNNEYQPAVMRNILNECFEHLNRHSYRFFSEKFSGSLVRKATKLSRAFENFIDRIYWDLTNLLTRITGSIAIITWYSPLLGLLLFVWMMLFIIGNVFAARWKYQAEVESNKWDSKLSGSLADAFTNSVNIKLFTSHKAEQLRFEKETHQWYKKTKKAWNRSAIISTAQAFLMVALEISILSLFVYLWSKGKVSLTVLVIVQSYLFTLLMRIWDFGRMINDIFRAFADAEEMIEVLHTDHEVKSPADAPPLQPTEAQIEFQQVSFAYQPGKWILKDFDLSIESGERIALVGHSGEGKSTITKLLMRLFDIQHGKILYDGQDVSKVQLDSLRQHISLVPQEPILFHRTLLENIRYGRPSASEEEVIKAAKMANAHQFITKTEKGYKTLVGERGVKLSGGERQRVAIARAILEDAPVVVLDEATSSLDSHSEKLIQQALQRLLKGKTAIMIAHRLSTIMEADRILVIEDGNIVEQGTHNTLLGKKGRYKQLWDIQAGGFIQD